MELNIFDANGDFDSDSEAVEYANGLVWSEVESSYQHVADYRYIDSSDDGTVDVYYNSIVDHYAFVEAEDEYDGQPDEAQEWYDFDPDC